jgi:hypothetical protein
MSNQAIEAVRELCPSRGIVTSTMNFPMNADGGPSRDACLRGTVCNLTFHDGDPMIHRSGTSAVKRRLIAAGMGLVLLAYATGCGGHSQAPTMTTSLEEAEVKGTVRVNDKPVTNGNLIFRASHVHRQGVPNRSCDIEKDGTFKIKLLVGENYVMVDCKELKNPKLRQFRDEDQLVIVKPGEEITIDIPPKP